MDQLLEQIQADPVKLLGVIGGVLSVLLSLSHIARGTARVGRTLLRPFRPRRTPLVNAVLKALDGAELFKMPNGSFRLRNGSVAVILHPGKPDQIFVNGSQVNEIIPPKYQLLVIERARKVRDKRLAEETARMDGFYAREAEQPERAPTRVFNLGGISVGVCCAEQGCDSVPEPPDRGMHCCPGGCPECEADCPGCQVDLMNAKSARDANERRNPRKET